MNSRKVSVKQICLDNVPRRGIKCYDWANSIGSKLNFIYNGIEGELKIVDYKKCSGDKKWYVFIEYLNKPPYKILPDSLADCRIGNLLKIFTKDFKIEIGVNFNDTKRNIVITERYYKKDKNRNIELKWYKYTCNRCGWTEGHIEEGDLLQGNGCSCCYGRTVVEGINDIPTTAPWIVKYFQGGYDEAKLYTQTSKKTIIPICPDCKTIKENKIAVGTIYLMKGISCHCGDSKSYPNKFMYNLLKQTGERFVSEKRYDWCKFNKFKSKNDYTFGIYDFVIEDKKLIIEMDGGIGHGHDNTGLYNFVSSDETLYKDNKKDSLAIKNGYTIIRIDCIKSNVSFIKNSILNSRLHKLIDLSHINWNECEEFACKNLVKTVCIYKMDNPEMTTITIGNVFGLSKTTVRTYLTKGTKLGWCNYDPKIEKQKSTSRGIDTIKSKAYNVEIFKDNISLGVFPSARYIEENSMDLFNESLNYSNISNSCRGKTKNSKGYVFKYITKSKALTQ